MTESLVVVVDAIVLRRLRRRGARCRRQLGTSSLHLCMIAAGIEPGDLIITTPFSFVASANCVLYEAGIPIFVDVP